jgi:N-acetylglutamate synthase-like GNAT family acetyltransferase
MKVQYIRLNDADNTLFTLAQQEDVNSLEMMINEAYRGEKGWTRETEIVSGTRISLKELNNILEDEQKYLFILKSIQQIYSCVCIEKRNSHVYLGLLVVNPNMKTKGIGKKVLLFAEEFITTNLQLDMIKIAVIKQRAELISFYKRRGFKEIDKIQAYPKNSDVGTPKVEGLQVVSLEKKL